jgi:hypothetical protein
LCRKLINQSARPEIESLVLLGIEQVDEKPRDLFKMLSQKESLASSPPAK